VDGPAVAVGDGDDGAVIAKRDAASMSGPIRADGEPAGVLEEGRRDEAGGALVLAGVERT